MKKLLSILALGLAAVLPAQAQLQLKSTQFTRQMLRSNDAASVRLHLGINAYGDLTNVLVGSTLLVDADNGNDSTALRGNHAFPFATVTGAVAAASSGDTIRLSPGTYDHGTNNNGSGQITVDGINLSFIGAGRALTWITGGDFNGQSVIKATNGATLFLSGLSVSNTLGSKVGVYGDGSEVFISDALVYGESDGVISGEGSTVVITDSEIIGGDDAIAIASLGGSLTKADIYNSRLRVTHVTDAAGNSCHGLVSLTSKGHIRMFGGEISMEYSDVQSEGTFAVKTTSGSTNELYGVTITMAGTSTDTNVFVEATNTKTTFGAVNYDDTSTHGAGTITYTAGSGSYANSAALAADLSDEVGTAFAVFSDSPVFTTELFMPEVDAAPSGNGALLIDTNTTQGALLTYTVGGVQFYVVATTNLGADNEIAKINAGLLGFEADSGSGTPPSGDDWSLQAKNGSAFNSVSNFFFQPTTGYVIVTNHLGDPFFLIYSNTASLKLTASSIGTLSSDALVFKTGDVSLWEMEVAGNFLPLSDGALNIGEDATRVATAYVDDLNIQSGGSLTMKGSGSLDLPDNFNVAPTGTVRNTNTFWETTLTANSQTITVVMDGQENKPIRLKVDPGDGYTGLTISGAVLWEDGTTTMPTLRSNSISRITIWEEDGQTNGVVEQAGWQIDYPQSSSVDTNAHSGVITVGLETNRVMLTAPFRADQTGATMITNDVTSEFFGQAIFDDAASEAGNWIEYQLIVPLDLDTNYPLVLDVWKFSLTGADTADHEYVLSMDSIPDSADAAGTMGQSVVLDFTADGSGAADDVESITHTTLTDWEDHITPGDKWVIRVARDGDEVTTDASTVNSRSQSLSIRYVSTGL